MTYSAIHNLLSGKRPVWLYKIDFDGAWTRYASSASGYDQDDHDIFDFNDIFETADLFVLHWAASPISHSRIERTTELEKATVRLVLPRTDPIIQAVRDSLGWNEASVSILHTYKNDPDAERQIRFLGRAVGVTTGIVAATLDCEHSLTTTRRKALSAVVQRPCRHALYHTGCGLSLAAFQVAGTATAVAGNTITVTEAAAQADGYYAGGIISFNGRLMMITKHAGTAITMVSALEGLAAEIAGAGSADVLIAPGCSLTMATCASRFSNLDNFGGFPWIDENPFDGRRIG